MKNRELSLNLKMIANLFLVFISLISILNMLSLSILDTFLNIPVIHYFIILAFCIWLLMITFPTSKDGENTLTDWHVMANNRLMFYIITFSLITIIHLGVIYVKIF